MSSAKAFKIIAHLSEAAVLEEQLFYEKDEEYTVLFDKDFYRENEFIRENGVLDDHPLHEPEKCNTISSVDNPVLKRLHKKLALKTHPDMNDGGTEEFKSIQEAFEKKDSATLLAAAISHDIDIELDEKDIQAMMADIRAKRQYIESRKNTFRWAWAESKRDEEAKKYIRAGLLIDELEFLEWLKVKNNKA